MASPMRRWFTPAGMVPQCTSVKELVAPPETISSFRPMRCSTCRASPTSSFIFSGVGLVEP